jgi:hypothetical protein
VTELIVPRHYWDIAEWAYLVLALVFMTWAMIRFVAALQGKRANLLTVPEWVAATFDVLMALGLFTAWLLLLNLHYPDRLEVAESLRLWTLSIRFVAAIVGTVMVTMYYVRMGDRLLRDFKQWRRERDAQLDTGDTDEHVD